MNKYFNRSILKTKQWRDTYIWLIEGKRKHTPNGTNFTKKVTWIWD